MARRLRDKFRDLPQIPTEIIKWDKERQRKRDDSAQVPLYIDDRPLPPGWGPNGRIEDDGRHDRQGGTETYEISMIWVFISRNVSRSNPEIWPLFFPCFVPYVLMGGSFHL